MLTNSLNLTTFEFLFQNKYSSSIFSSSKSLIICYTKFLGKEGNDAYFYDIDASSEELKRRVRKKKERKASSSQGKTFKSK